jgi:hypothetical protein
LDRLWNTTQRLKSSRPKATQALSRPTGGVFVEVELAVALVGSDHEVVFVGQGDQFFQGVERDQRAGRIAWRAQEQDLAALPGFDGTPSKSGLKPCSAKHGR